MVELMEDSQLSLVLNLLERFDVLEMMALMKEAQLYLLINLF